MKKKKKPLRVSLIAVAKAAGVSKAAASFALLNKPGVSKATRARVLRIAKQLNYSPDAHIASWMAKVRNAKSKDLLPIAWLSTHWEEDAWKKFKFMSPYLEGAREEALRLGYRIEEIWANQPKMTMQRLSQILYQRGIEGAIISHPARHIRLKWDHLACVSLEGALLAPKLHRVMTDLFFNFLLALKAVKRFGYRRVGICLENFVDRYSHHACHAAAHRFCATAPKSERIVPLFYQWGMGDMTQVGANQVVTWIRENRPDVIVGHSNHLVDWAKMAGYRVPEEVGVVHIANDDDVADWTGIHSNRRGIGAAAVELVVSHIQNRQFGVPKTALNILIRGTWSPGHTLLIPKPK